jgi:hypothetical protein
VTFKNLIRMSSKLTCGAGLTTNLPQPPIKTPTGACIPPFTFHFIGFTYVPRGPAVLVLSSAYVRCVCVARAIPSCVAGAGAGGRRLQHKGVTAVEEAAGLATWLGVLLSISIRAVVAGGPAGFQLSQRFSSSLAFSVRESAKERAPTKKSSLKLCGVHSLSIPTNLYHTHTALPHNKPPFLGRVTGAPVLTPTSCLGRWAYH